MTAKPPESDKPRRNGWKIATIVCLIIGAFDTVGSRVVGIANYSNVPATLKAQQGEIDTLQLREQELREAYAAEKVERQDMKSDIQEIKAALIRIEDDVRDRNRISRIPKDQP